MKLATKLTLGGAIGIGIWISVNQKNLIEHSIKHQINHHFRSIKEATIYGTWMRKISTNPFDHHYHGGVNVNLHRQLYQYRFVTNKYGKIQRMKLINRVPYPRLES